ncbi:MAG: WS/DGAT domain-containing protein, partial [Anaerolineae bacterium]
AIAGLRVPLGTDVGDPRARLEAIKAAMQAVRKDRASLPADAVTPYVLLRAAPVYASQLPGVGALVPPVFNLAVSNSHGAQKTRYYNGARLEAIYPMNPLMQYSALSIDCVDYDDDYYIGFTGARDTLPHLQRMAVYFVGAVSDLEERVSAGEFQ